MSQAHERVIANRGSAGIDGMAVEELNGYLIKHYRKLGVSFLNWLKIVYNIVYNIK